MKHVHHDMIVEWAKDTSRVVQVSRDGGPWIETGATPGWFAVSSYRFKPAEPKYIVVNGIQVPEPVREPLEEGQLYWLASASLGSAQSYYWDSTVNEKYWLSLGLIHMTREAAQAHIDAMLLPSRSDK